VGGGAHASGHMGNALRYQTPLAPAGVTGLWRVSPPRGFPPPTFPLNLPRPRESRDSPCPAFAGLRDTPISGAMEMLSTGLQDPIGSEFGLVADGVTYGAELTDALHAMAERWDLDDLRMFVVSLAVQSETGGNLAEILENLNKVIRDRSQLFLKVRALSSEGRISAAMLTVLPVLSFLVLFLLNPAFYLEVAGDPLFTLGFGSLLGLYLIGFWMMRKMVDLKVYR